MIAMIGEMTLVGALQSIKDLAKQDFRSDYRCVERSNNDEPSRTRIH